MFPNFCSFLFLCSFMLYAGKHDFRVARTNSIMAKTKDYPWNCKKYKVMFTIMVNCSVPLSSLILIMILLHLHLIMERLISRTCQKVIAKKEIWASCICPYSKFGGNSRFMSHSFLGIINTTTQYHIKPPCRKNDSLHSNSLILWL